MKAGTPYVDQFAGHLARPDGTRVVRPVSGPSRSTRRTLLPYLLLFLLLGTIYHRIFVKLVEDWYSLPDFSHGFLVPLFAAWVLWEGRTAMQAVVAKPSWIGIPLVLLGIGTLFAGVYGAELFFSRISFILILAGIILSLFGTAMFRHVAFALAVLLLAIPVPAIIFNQITFPLQLLASQGASQILTLLGVPILREGNVIQLPAMRLQVAEACSGIRSLMSLFTLAVVLGHFLEGSRWRYILLALSSIPIAVAANTLRIVGTGLCVQFWDPDKALGFFHEFSGWVMFVISFGCLYLVHLTMALAPAGKRIPQ